jgi:adenine deaminase
MNSLTRFSVQPLRSMTRQLADVASGRIDPDLVNTGARVLSAYSERILPAREIRLSGGRIAAVKPAGAESSMATACAYAEAAPLDVTTTIFCDSHEAA